MTGLASEISCPSLEELTAFTEGQLDGEARARILGHLNRCPLCREVLAEAARLEDDLAGFEEGTFDTASQVTDERNAKPALIVPFPQRLEEELANFGPPHPDRIKPTAPQVRRRRFRPGLRWVAAIVIGGLGLWGGFLLAPPGGMSSDDYLQTFVRKLPPDQRHTLLGAVLPASRGPVDSVPMGQGLEFHYGELLADQTAACAVPVAERNREDDRCERAKRAIGLLLKNNDAAPKTPKEMRLFLDLQLGRWNEAARLALETTKQEQYFENSAVRRFPAWLLRQEQWPWLSERLGYYPIGLPASARTALQEAKDLLSDGKLDSKKLSQLSDKIGEISSAYKELSDPLEP